MSLTGVPAVESAVWMDNGKELHWKQEDGIFTFKPYGFRYGTSLCVRVAEIKFKEI